MSEPFDLKPGHHEGWPGIVAGPFYFEDDQGKQYMFQVNKDRVIACRRAEPGEVFNHTLKRLTMEQWLAP